MTKIKYDKRHKQRDLEYVGKGIVDNNDPRIKYFQKCFEVENLNLPILDKIYRKTLCLHEYTLSEGHCKGLAEACKYFNTDHVNRVMFNNCGIDGDEFAEILKGLNALKDVKSIIYKMNHINANSIKNLLPILEKRLPNHLQELKLIDCQIHNVLIE